MTNLLRNMCCRRIFDPTYYYNVILSYIDEKCLIFEDISYFSSSFHTIFNYIYLSFFL